MDISLIVPFDQARLRVTPLLVIILAVVSSAYGWCLEKKVNIAGPLVLQFVSEYQSLNSWLQSFTVSPFFLLIIALA